MEWDGEGVVFEMGVGAQLKNWEKKSSLKVDLKWSFS